MFIFNKKKILSSLFPLFNMLVLRPEEGRRFAHDTHIPSILSTTGCLRFSLKMGFEVKISR
jgi:hypothetical protein